jgi:hypothetical protein
VIRVEEVHNSLLFAAVLAVPALVMLTVAASHSIPGVRACLGVGGVVMLGAALMAWSGFHYVFTDAGLEVRTLGYRLRSIAPADIREYYPAQWSVAGGYGIRGLGASRAYVWGNRGVRIKLVDGEIFLGSSNSQELIRNLDQLTHGGHS